jgi:hypothetical protein
MKFRSAFAALLVFAVLGGWWAWKHSPSSGGGMFDGLGNPFSQRSSRASFAADANKRVTLSSQSLGYQTQLDDMRVLIRLGGQNRLKELLLEWTQVDPHAAFQWAKGLADEENEFYENELCAKVIKAVAATDPVKAQTMLASCPDLEDGDAVIAAIVQKLGETDPESAWRYLSSVPIDDKAAASWKVLGSAMVRHDLPRALKFLEEVTIREKEPVNRSNLDYFLCRILLLDGISNEWARKDLEAALQWAGDLPSEEKPYALKAICPVWVLSDPQAAFEFLLKDEDSNGIAIDETFRAWGEKDPASALRFIDDRSLNSSELFLSTVYKQWAKSNPSEALADARTRGDSEVREEAIRHVFDQLLHHAPQDAPALLSDMHGSARASATVDLIYVQSVSDPAAAMKLLSELNPPALRRLAGGGLATLIADEHPDLATELLMTLKHSDSDEGYMEYVALQWLYRNEEAGKKRLLNMGIPEKTIAEWNAKIPSILTPPSVGTSFGER